MKQAIIYTRFSPRPNADASKSNEQQEIRCYAYCERKDYRVNNAIGDTAITGKRLDRPGLNKVLSELQPGMVLVVDTADRLARDILVALTINATVVGAGCTVEYADGSQDRTTPEGELLQNVLAAFAHYERQRYARRTKAGIAKKIASGVRVGRPPIGRQVIDGKLVAHYEEQEAIKHAMLFHNQGVNSKDIACILTRCHGLCRGQPWSARTVRKILANNK